MQEDELPEYLRESVEKLRRKGASHERVVERLLEQRRNGSAEERRQVDEMLVSLSTPRRVRIWIGLAALLVVAGVVVPFVVSERNHAAAVAAGRKTLARVTRLEDGHCTLGQKGFKCLRLTLEVHPEQRPSYVAELTHDIDMRWMSRVQPSSWLTVSVDHQDRNKIYFDEPSLAVAPPSPPAAR